MKNLNLLKLKFIDKISGLKIYDVLKHLKSEQYLPKEELDKRRYEKLDRLFLVAKQSTTYYSGMI